MDIKNTIHCGDCLEIMSKFEDNTIDLILTSPPYFNQRNYDVDGIGNEINLNDYINILMKVTSECERILKSSGLIVFNLGDKYLKSSLQLIPFRYAISVIDNLNLKLVNELTWCKSNPTPRSFKNKLISATEPFFIFSKSNKYTFNNDDFLKKLKTNNKRYKNSKIGQSYFSLIDKSSLSDKEKKNAIKDLNEVINEVKVGNLHSFRMKIRGIHSLAYGGMSGGRNNQINKNGYTIIRMSGRKMKRDIIEHSVANNSTINHPAIFPENLIKEIILLCSNKNDIVLDPFCGSGTTLKVAKILNRNYIGIDISSTYCDISSKLLEF